MTTRAQLREYIKTEARVKVSTNLDDYINGLMLEILRDYCNKSRYYELYVVDVNVTLVAQTGVIALPSNFNVLDKTAIRYTIGPATPSPNSSRFRTLYEKTDVVRRTSNNGYPLYFQLVSAGTPPSPGLLIFPFNNIQATDQLVVSYWQDPVAIFNNDADNFPIPRLMSTIKKAAISRVQRYSQSLEEAQVMDQDATGSFTAAESGR